jgi:pseudaminic acid biosynthesis-associated methylase
MNAQEQAWAGTFGNDYHRRAPGNEEANYALFKRALIGHNLTSAIELGCGTGANLSALHRLRPGAELHGIELNREAAERAAQRQVASIYNASLLDWEPERTWDLALTKGLLIHIEPEHLPLVYELLHRAAARWILLAEYYNPTPVSVPYRGEDELLWKRDFAGDMLDRYPDLQLIDYGFVYRRDAKPQDDLTWFLMEKSR